MNDKTQKLIAVDPVLWRRFRARCDLAGATVTEMMEKALSGFLGADETKQVKEVKDKQVKEVKSTTGRASRFRGDA